MKAPHHKGTHHRNSALVRRAANNNPLTTCWACGRTLTDHPPHANGKPPRWQAGHTIDGTRNPPIWISQNTPPTPPPPGPWLVAEASTCNSTRGAILGAQRQSTGYDWP